MKASTVAYIAGMTLLPVAWFLGVGVILVTWMISSLNRAISEPVQNRLPQLQEQR